MSCQLVYHCTAFIILRFYIFFLSIYNDTNFKQKRSNRISMVNILSTFFYLTRTLIKISWQAYCIVIGFKEIDRQTIYSSSLLGLWKCTVISLEVAKYCFSTATKSRTESGDDSITETPSSRSRQPDKQSTSSSYTRSRLIQPQPTKQVSAKLR